MTPQQALHLISEMGGAAGVPAIYKTMPLPMLMNLVEECAKPTLEERLAKLPAPKLQYNALDRLLGREPPTIAPIANAPDKLCKPLERALANPRRLRLPSRQRAAFLRQLHRCPSVAEAAARAGVNRGSVYKWRAEDPAFALRWDAAIARQAAEVDDNLVLRAGRVEVKPLYFGGRRVGEVQRFNDKLQMYLQRRLDAQRRHAEDRKERLRLAELKGGAPADPGAFAAAVAAHLRSHLVTPESSAIASTSASVSKDLSTEAGEAP